MAIRILKSAGNWLAWCFLTSVCIASVEALGYMATHGADEALSLPEFAVRLANTCGVLLIVTSATWFVAWLLMSWLGGIRAGLTLFLVLGFYLVFGFASVWVDMLLAFVPQMAPHQALLVKDALVFAMVAAGLATLIAGKVSRRRPVTLTVRGFNVLAVLLAAAAFSLCYKAEHFTRVPAGIFWGGFAAASVLLLMFVWWLGGRPYMKAVTAAALSAAVFVTPWAMPATPAAPKPAGSAAPHAVKHVILITIDTLRQDVLGCYTGVSNTPHIDAFARHSVLFQNAYSCAPWTYPSVASILTGLPPRVHQLTDGRTRLSASVRTMAEYMAEAGYGTAALGFNGVLMPRSSLNKGFQEYAWFPTRGLQIPNFEVGLTHALLERTGDSRPSTSQLTDLAIQWFRQKGSHDTLFWLHYFDPHIPYTPPEEYLTNDPEQRARGSFFWDVKMARGGGVARTDKERAWIRGLYEAEVRYIDAQFGRLMDALKAQGLYDDSLIVLTSDHGEEFWDHGRFEHGHTLYNELLRVPLIIKLPGNAGGNEVQTPVSTRGIMPTVLDLCGLTPASAEALAPALSPLLREGLGAYAEQPVFSGATLFYDPAECVIFDGMKYIRQLTTGHEMLFNLSSDPKELNSIAAQDPANLEKGRQLLDAELAAAPQQAEKLGIRVEETDKLDPQAIQNLQALGYL